MTKPSPRSRKSTSSKTRSDQALIFTVIKSVLNNFVECIKYRTYALKKKSYHIGRYVPLNIAKFVKQIQSQLKWTDFDEADLMPILAFLKEFKDACNSIGVHKVDAMYLVPHFVKKPEPS